MPTAVHPGYGFLAENADFAQAVIDAGLTWIGPTPQAIRDLGDKVTARHIAQRVGAPLVPGTAEPVKGADEVIAFAKEHGLPVAIKAAFGGGGRGLKVARTLAEIPDLLESATREAVAAFGRGECFVERYLDQPRHVEAQVLADQHGNVIVVGTRDCSLQRRHQKLVEEAPAPFLTSEQREAIHTSAKAICREAGYHGAGTVEYLVGADGTISFLEVNTRLQVEHPVTEETSGIDLVREQFRIADGEKLRFTADPEPRGHSIEFRINGEDAGRGLPARTGCGHHAEAAGGSRGPGRHRHRVGRRHRRELRLAAGQGDHHRRDPHRGAGAVPPRARRDGRRGHGHGAAVPPAHRARSVLCGGTVPGAHPVDRDRVGEHGRPAHRLPPSRTAPPRSGPPSWSRSAASGSRCRCRPPWVRSRLAPRRPHRPSRAAPSVSRAGHASAVSGNALASPMQGTIVKVAVSEGDTVAEGDLVVVLEAMKMEQPLNAHRAGVITGLTAEVGGAVTAGAVICEIV